MSDWRYPGFPPEEDAKNPCDGCHECGLRCSAGIQMTRNEFDLILGHLKQADPADASRVLAQNKELPWFEDIFREACLFYDVTRRGCLIYAVRPLVCRLFGRVEWLPCPLGRPLPQIRRGVEIMLIYASERRATFGEWCMESGISDLRRALREA